jgi:hypothetical protein
LGAATLASFDYGFDTDGKILSIADAGGTRSFTYDATLQLTGGGYPTATEPRVESYAYDPEGNRTSSHLSTGYAHDQANRLRSDADTCYDYDANGNLVTKREKVGLDCTDTSGAATTYGDGTCSTASRASTSPTPPTPPTATTRRDGASRRTSTAR